MARPEKIIDWEDVKIRIQSGNSAKTIALEHNININTFYNKFKEEFGCNFQDYKDESTQCRKQNIEYTQYKKALEGNVQMLIRLGEIYCDQNIETPKANSNIIMVPDDLSASSHLLSQTISEEHNPSLE